MTDMLQVLKFRQCALWSEADTFDELSRATVEALKKGLVNSKDYKRMEPLLDFGFALADGQLASALKELVNTDLASELDVPTSATDGNAALTELRDALGSLTHVEKVESVQATVPKMSWRQLARCNSDTLADNAELARSALAQEREEKMLKKKQMCELIDGFRFY